MITDTDKTLVLDERPHFKKSRCTHPGCSYSSWDPSRTELHELEPHTQCSCGRFFTERALSAHIGYVTSRRVAHRPFGSDLSEIGHDPYRTACDNLLDWAYELNEAVPEAKLEGSYVAGRILAFIASELITRPADQASA